MEEKKRKKQERKRGDQEGVKGVKQDNQKFNYL